MAARQRRAGSRVQGALRAVLAAAAASLLLRPAGAAFTCTRSGFACAALGDLYAATNGPGWRYLPSASGVSVPPSAWAAAAAGNATDYCTFEGAACDTTSTLVSLCVPALLASGGA